MRKILGLDSTRRGGWRMRLFLKGVIIEGDEDSLLPPGPLGVLLLSLFRCCVCPSSCKQKQVQAGYG